LVEDTKGVITKSESINRKRTDNTIAKRKRTKHTHKTKDLVTLAPLKTVGELRCSGRIGRFLLHRWHLSC